MIAFGTAAAAGAVLPIVACSDDGASTTHYAIDAGYGGFAVVDAQGGADAYGGTPVDAWADTPDADAAIAFDATSDEAGDADTDAASAASDSGDASDQ
jgi:hypothetical protein